MAADKFWNNREQAQKLIEEANSLRGKTEPLLKAEKKLEDFQVMVELGEAEPEASQVQIQKELERDLSRFFKELEALELEVFLSGPHDKSNCIMSINAGAGGTESCAWAHMLVHAHQHIAPIARACSPRPSPAAHHATPSVMPTAAATFQSQPIEPLHITRPL